jgi:signal transduction histidine kinase
MSIAAVIPGPRSAAEQEAGIEQAVRADEHRIAMELVDTVIRDLFGVGLTLQRALAQVNGPAAQPVTDAIDGIDRVIRSIRDVVFGLSQPPATGSLVYPRARSWNEG